MKILQFLGICAILLFQMAACHSDQGRPISEMTDMNAVDSMIYYYGQMRAHDFARLATADTFLRQPENKEAYLKGLRDGFKLIEGDDEAYNLGARAGLSIALAAKRFERQYDAKPDHKLLLRSIEYGIYNQDSLRDLELSDQKKLSTLLRKLSIQQRQNDIKAAQEAVAQAAKKLGMTRVGPSLYSRMLKKSDGVQISKGMTIVADVDYSRLDGNDLGMPNPEELTVGSEGMPDVMTRAYSSLCDKESAEFITSAYEIFGERCAIIDLDPEDVILIKISINDCIDSLHNSDSTL